MRALSSFLLSLALCAALPARAAQQRLAVLELELAPGAAIDRTYFSDLARTAAHRRAPHLFVMTRESTEMLLAATGKTLADCTGGCEVEVGRKLGADFIVSGRVAQIGSWLTLTVRLFATESGQMLESAEARGKSADDLLERADAALQTLFAPLVEKAVSAPPPLAAREPPPERALAAPLPAPAAALSVATPPRAAPARLPWVCLGAGALLGGGSLAFDLRASTSKDGKLTKIDFLPVAGYAVALALGVYGVYQLVRP